MPVGDTYIFINYSRALHPINRSGLKEMLISPGVIQIMIVISNVGRAPRGLT